MGFLRALVPPVTLITLTLAVAAPAQAAVEAKKKPKPGGSGASSVIAPGRYTCSMVDPYKVTVVTFKGGKYSQSYENGDFIGKGTYRPAPDVAPQFGGSTVWFTGGGFGGFPGEFVPRGTADPRTGEVAATNSVEIFATPGGFSVVTCFPR